MSAILKILRRDIKRAARSGGSWAFGLVFMAIFLALCAIALNEEMSVLRSFGVPLIWLALTFASLMSVDRIFAEDLRDGTTGQLWLSGVSYMTQAAAGILSFAVISLLPLILTTPLWSLLFDLPADTVVGLCVALFCAAPGMAAFTALSGALTGARGKGRSASHIWHCGLRKLRGYGLDCVRITRSCGFVSARFSAINPSISCGLSCEHGSINAFYILPRQPCALLAVFPHCDAALRVVGTWPHCDWPCLRFMSLASRN